MGKVLSGGQLAGGNPTNKRVENDFYATDPEALRMLMREYEFNISKGIGGVIMQEERTIIDNRKLDLEWWDDGEEIEKGDGTVHHIVRHGSRRHVLYWDSNGEHCKEPRCEINRKKED